MISIYYTPKYRLPGSLLFNKQAISKNLDYVRPKFIFFWAVLIFSLSMGLSCFWWCNRKFSLVQQKEQERGSLYYAGFYEMKGKEIEAVASLWLLRNLSIVNITINELGFPSVFLNRQRYMRFSRRICCCETHGTPSANFPRVHVWWILRNIEAKVVEEAAGSYPWS